MRNSKGQNVFERQHFRATESEQQLAVFIETKTGHLDHQSRPRFASSQSIAHNSLFGASNSIEAMSV